MKIIRQGIHFGVIGILQVGVDWLVFVLLTYLGVYSAAANISGRITGAGIGFWLNGTVTFSDGDGARLRGSHFAKFVVTWCFTTLLGTVVVATISSHYGIHAAWMAKPVVDCFLAGLSFVASKYWVYR